MYAIFRNAFECALPMKAYPSMPTPISAISPRRAALRRSAVRLLMPLCIAASKATADGREVGLPHERERVLRAPLAIHPAVLPLDRQRPGVADPVQRAEELLEVDVAVAGRDEVPAARLLAEVEVRAEDRPPPVQPLARVLDVDVVDPVGELERELARCRGTGARSGDGSRLIPKPSRLPIASSVLRVGDEVVGDLGRVHLEPELDALRVEDVDDRRPALGEVLVAALDLGEVVRREGIEQVPDRRAGEAVHLLDAEPRRRPRRVLHPLGRALPDALRIAVAPDLRRQDPAVARRRSGRRPPARRGARRARSSSGGCARGSPGCGRRSRPRRAPGRPRSGRPSRRARARRSPSGRPSRRAPRAAGRPTGR